MEHVAGDGDGDGDAVTDDGEAEAAVGLYGTWAAGWLHAAIVMATAATASRTAGRFMSYRIQRPEAVIVTALLCNRRVSDFEAGLLHLQEAERSSFRKTYHHASCKRNQHDDGNDDERSTGLQRSS
jgi:hypothetical protein